MCVWSAAAWWGHRVHHCTLTQPPRCRPLSLFRRRKRRPEETNKCFFSSEQIKIWSSTAPEEAIWMWKENQGQLWMCVWFHKAMGGGSDHTELLVERRPDVLRSGSAHQCRPVCLVADTLRSPGVHLSGGRGGHVDGTLHMGHWQHKPQPLLINQSEVTEYFLDFLYNFELTCTGVFLLVLHCSERFYRRVSYCLWNNLQ